jgi:hypothetical protein
MNSYVTSVAPIRRRALRRLDGELVEIRSGPRGGVRQGRRDGPQDRDDQPGEKDVNASITKLKALQLTCVAPTVPRPPAAAAILPPPLGPPAPQPLTNPAPNPAANVEVNPAPNPAQAPQAQAQAVGQAVVVPQPEVQPQLALQRVANEAQQNHAMSALRPGRADGLRAATHLVLVGGALVFAGGCALKRRAIRAWAWGASSTSRREATR